MHTSSPLAEIPIDRTARWALLREFASQWYPAIESLDGFSADELNLAVSRLGIPLPAAFREWYALSGRRNDIWSLQDHLLPPDKLRLNSDHLTFLIENQHVVEWGVRVDDLTIDDPPVYVTTVDAPSVWLQENDSLSEFAIQMLAYCLKWSGKRRWWANAYVMPDVLKRVATNYPRLPLTEWNWPAATRFYGYRDIIAEVETEAGDDHAWLYVATRTARAAESFKENLGDQNIEWNSWSEDWPSGWVSASKDLDG